MCILFVHWSPALQSKGYRLILASNRDEIYRRPTSPVHCWTDDPNVYGGRDQVRGGSWLAINKETGRLAVILNVLDGTDPHKKSRGEIVHKYVRLPSKTSQIDSFLSEITNTGKEYSLFNLILGEIESDKVNMKVYSNANLSSWEMEPDISYGFGNSPSNPSGECFEKVKYGRQQFDSIVNEYNKLETLAEPEKEDAFIKKLITILQSKQEHFPDPLLESMTTHYPKEHVKSLSSLFINSKNIEYGTRNHTVILVDKNNRIKHVDYSLQDPIEDPIKSQWIIRTETFLLDF